MALLKTGRGFGALAPFLATLCHSLLAGNATIAAQTVDEYSLKAAVLYKLPSFVEWPAEGGSGPQCIAVVGRDPFGSALDQMVKDKSVNGRQLEIRRLRLDQSVADCQVVFFGAAEKKVILGMLSRLKTAPVLTVGDFSGFCQSGGMVNLAMEAGRVRLEINLAAAAAARLRLSSKLLSLATIVIWPGHDPH